MIQRRCRDRVPRRVPNLPSEVMWRERKKECESAPGPDADRRRNTLIYFAAEGVGFGAYSHSATSSVVADFRTKKRRSVNDPPPRCRTLCTNSSQHHPDLGAQDAGRRLPSLSRISKPGMAARAGTFK
jgi:hypothetical protein